MRERERGAGRLSATPHACRWPASKQRKRSCTGLICLAVAYIAGALAHAADPKAGQRQSVGCIGCHNESTHDLAGADPTWLKQRMLVIRDGQLPTHPPVFGLLTPSDLDDIAAYFASIER